MIDFIVNAWWQATPLGRWLLGCLLLLVTYGTWNAWMMRRNRLRMWEIIDELDELDDAPNDKSHRE